VIQDGNNKGEMQSAFWPLAEAIFVYQLMFLSSWLVFAGSVDLLFKRICLRLTLAFDILMLNLPTGVAESCVICRGTCLFFFSFYYK